MDGEDLEIEVHPDDMEKLMTSMGTGEVFFSECSGVGVWVAIDKVRYFNVEFVNAKGIRIRKSREQLPKCDGGLECGRSGDPEKGAEGLEDTSQGSFKEKSAYCETIPFKGES